MPEALSGAKPCGSCHLSEYTSQHLQCERQRQSQPMELFPASQFVTRFIFTVDLCILSMQFAFLFLLVPSVEKFDFLDLGSSFIKKGSPESTVMP